MKRCPRCQTVRPLGEFPRDRQKAGGVATYCSPCNRARVAAWKTADPERARASKARDHRKHRVSRAAKAAAWKEANRRRVNELNRQYKARAKARDPQRWAMQARLDARLRRRTGHGADYGLVVAGDPCSYCAAHGGTVDHIVPIKAGGTNDWANLTGSCLSCNSRKSARPLLHFLLAKGG